MIRLAVLLLLAAGGIAQTEWPSYGNDPGAMRYSSLVQIHAANVVRLKLAWTFRTGKSGSEATPIVVDGIMYLTAPDGVYAVVPETGELLWRYGAAPMALRGLAYWKATGSLHSRVFAGNGVFVSVKIRCTSGKPAPGFGNEGRVDLKQGVLGDLTDGRYALESPPAVFGDIVITGCSNGEGSPTVGAYGDIRGWDAKTGKLLWTFEVPFLRPGKWARRLGPPAVGRIDPGPTCGGSSRSTQSVGLCTRRSVRRRRISMARIESGTICGWNPLVALLMPDGQEEVAPAARTTTFGTMTWPRRRRYLIFTAAGA